MTKKLSLLAVLALALLGAGCEDPCEKGLALRNDEAQLEALVANTVLSPSALGGTCEQVSNHWNKVLQKGSDFASRMATEYFYSEEQYCTRGHYDRRCDYDPSYPNYPDPSHTLPPHGRTVCGPYYVCDDLETIPHKRDGYEQALEVYRQLWLVKDDLRQACAANAVGDTVGALAALNKSKGDLASVEKNTDYVLNRAGCFKSSRRGD